MSILYREFLTPIQVGVTTVNHTLPAHKAGFFVPFFRHVPAAEGRGTYQSTQVDTSSGQKPCTRRDLAYEWGFSSSADVSGVEPLQQKGFGA